MVHGCACTGCNIHRAREHTRTGEGGRKRERGNDNVGGRGGLGGRRSRRRPSNPVFTFIRSLARVAHIHIFISTPFLHPLGGYTRICSRHGGQCACLYMCVWWARAGIRVKRTPRSNVTVFHVDARGSAVPWRMIPDVGPSETYSATCFRNFGRARHVRTTSGPVPTRSRSASLSLSPPLPPSRNRDITLTLGLFLAHDLRFARLLLELEIDYRITVSDDSERGINSNLCVLSGKWNAKCRITSFKFIFKLNQVKDMYKIFWKSTIYFDLFLKDYT